MLLADVELFSFSGNGALLSNTPSEFGDYDGIIRLRRLPRLSCLVAPSAATLETPDFLFKVKRKRLLIEPLSTPPDERANSSMSGCNTHGAAAAPASNEPRSLRAAHAARAASQLDF